MTQTAQVNIRLSEKLKKTAQQKAEDLGVSLSFLVKQFLIKFAQEEDIIELHSKVDLEKIFDEGVISYMKDKKGKEKINALNKKMSELK